MMNENRIEISLSKSKLFFAILGSIMFVVGGIWILISQESIFYKGVGIASILFFGATGIYSVIKSFDRQMGLIIDSKGIFDNSTGASIGLIK